MRLSETAQGLFLRSQHKTAGTAGKANGAGATTGAARVVCKFHLQHAMGTEGARPCRKGAECNHAHPDYAAMTTIAKRRKFQEAASLVSQADLKSALARLTKA